jgi:hypothetical protein
VIGAGLALRARLWDNPVNEALEAERGGWRDLASSAVCVLAVCSSATRKFLGVGSQDGRISIWENIAQNS